MAHVVVFAGEYDLANKERVRRTMRRLASSDNLALDLTKVTYIDSTFIAELIILETARQERNLSRLTVVAPAESVVRRLFEVAGMTSILRLVESYDAGGDHPDTAVEFAPHGDKLDEIAETTRADETSA